eukprot:3128793-Pleurochrysis_carterae.AAC.5
MLSKPDAATQNPSPTHAGSLVCAHARQRANGRQLSRPRRHVPKPKLGSCQQLTSLACPLCPHPAALSSSRFKPLPTSTLTSTLSPL